MNVFKTKATRGVKFLRPHSEILAVPGASSVRVFPLGPPRDADQLASLDPEGDEGFHLAGSSASGYFAAAARSAERGEPPEAPFSSRYAVPWNSASTATASGPSFFARYHGAGENSPLPPEVFETPSNAEWRRIDDDWLYASTQLALDMNNQTNNSSLVLAFELGKGGKVLLFAADAQRGNWVSWARKDFSDSDQRVSVRELLSRTILYKVGHHAQPQRDAQRDVYGRLCQSRLARGGESRA